MCDKNDVASLIWSYLEDTPNKCNKHTKTFLTDVLHPMLGVFFKKDTPAMLLRWIADFLKHADDIFKKEVRNINEGNTEKDENIAEDSENAEPSAVGFHEKGGLCDQMIRYFIQIVEEKVTNHE